MSPNISQNLSRISSASAAINLLATQATEQIRALNQFLEKSGIGIELQGPWLGAGRESVVIGRDQDDKKTVEVDYHLGYDRDDAGGPFCLVITAFGPDLDFDGVQKSDTYGQDAVRKYWVGSLERQSRQLRIAAMEKMSEFLESLAKKSEETASNLKKHIGQTASVVDELKTALNTKPSKSK